jgi:uncharacterized protein (TIGR00255 family)
MRRRILRTVRRGRVEVNVRIETADETHAGPTLNHTLLAEVLRSAELLSRDHGVSGEPDVIGVLSIPGMFRVETGEIDWNDERLATVFGALDEAIERFDTDRLREGELLGVDLATRIEAMLEEASRATALAPSVPERLREKLLQRLSSLEGKVELDPVRIAQEAAFLADRADVTEELVRLQGHLGQTRRLLENTDAKPLGKRLEFLFQEIHREANTVCSKSAELELTRHALTIKLEVEKAREQAQNLE